MEDDGDTSLGVIVIEILYYAFDLGLSGGKFLQILDFYCLGIGEISLNSHSFRLHCIVLQSLGVLGV